ncbi:MAG: hypothetical protein ACLU38_08075 [Dysosmobacter sp.]
MRTPPLPFPLWNRMQMPVLELAEGPHAVRFRAQEVYRKVSGAVVTVAVDLDGSRRSVGTGVIFQGRRLHPHQPPCGGRGQALHGAAVREDARLCGRISPATPRYDLAVF